MGALAEAGLLVLWAGLWALGGIWLVRASFNLRDNEQVMAGLGLGVVVQTWGANLLAQVMPVQGAFWLAAGLTFVLGLALSFPLRRPLDLLRFPIRPWQFVLLAVLTYVFYVTGRGLGLLDDFQNLPITSFIGAGDIPPHFPLNPDVVFGYHYFSMLFAGELMRIGNMFVWSAIDLGRAFGFALSLILSGLFVQRVTRSVLGGIIGAMMSAFGGGTRWLLLLLPVGVINRISEHIHMIGSGVGYVSDLKSALLTPWAAAGMGPYPFPFAFVNGFNAASIITYHAGAGGVAGAIGGLLALTHNKWRNWRAWVSMTILLAALAIGNEVRLLQLGLGFLLVGLVVVIMRVRQSGWKKLKIPYSLYRWYFVLALATLLAVLQGGVLTGIFSGWVARLLPELGFAQAYHTFHFSFFWPPAVLSSHLGYLYLTNPYQLLVAALEVGPVLLVLPWAIAWWIKAFRYERWYEASSISVLISLPMAFIEYSGTAGITALTRVQGILISSCKGMAVPALWLWVRQRSGRLKVLVGVFWLSLMFGGIVLFGIQLIAAPKPVYSYFLNDLDAKMTAKYWNKLDKGALVLDNDAYRAPVVFARGSKASPFDWFERSPEWEAVLEDPDPYRIKDLGYDYFYFDQTYWDGLSQEKQALLNETCVQKMDEYTQVFPQDFRRLLDLRACHK